MCYMLTKCLMEACLLQSSSTDREGFVNIMRKFVRIKAIKVSEFLDDSETAGCLIDNNKLMVMVNVKYIRTNPRTIT